MGRFLIRLGREKLLFPLSPIKSACRMSLPQYSSLRAYALFAICKLLLKEDSVFHSSQFQTFYGAVPENKKPNFQDCMNYNDSDSSVNIQSALVLTLEIVKFPCRRSLAPGGPR